VFLVCDYIVTSLEISGFPAEFNLWRSWLWGPKKNRPEPLVSGSVQNLKKVLNQSELSEVAPARVFESD
jgi:hypothetical protein